MPCTECGCEMEITEEIESEVVGADGTEWGNWIIEYKYECQCCENYEYRYDAE